MSDHDNRADVAGLLQGGLDNIEVLRSREHLASCPECRDAALDALVGHALLQRTAGTLSDDSSARCKFSSEPAAPRRALGSLPSRHRRSATVLLVAATLVVAAVLVALLRPEAGGGEPPAERAATLEPLVGDGGGRVSMTGSGSATRMVIATHDLPALREDEFYYAWLLEPATSKMLPLGQVGPSGASFEVSDALLQGYSAVNVSLEADDGDPQHSPTSVLRGSYA